MGVHTYLLDGDNVRHGLNKDLGFTDADRVENIRRVAEVAALMVDAGLIVLVVVHLPVPRRAPDGPRPRSATASSSRSSSTPPLEVAEARDRKGLYAKARRGELANFTGIDSPYEEPESPEIHLDASGAVSAEAAADQVIDHLRAPASSPHLRLRPSALIPMPTSLLGTPGSRLTLQGGVPPQTAGWRRRTARVPDPDVVE